MFKVKERALCSMVANLGFYCSGVRVYGYISLGYTNSYMETQCTFLHDSRCPLSIAFLSLPDTELVGYLRWP